MKADIDPQVVAALELAKTVDKLAKVELVGAGLDDTPEKPRLVRPNPSFASQLRYVRYLCIKVPQYIRQRQIAKAQGKLQFALGVLWASGCISVRTMRDLEAYAVRRGHASYTN